MYQRDANGKAEIPIALDESVKDGKLISAMVAQPRATPGSLSARPTQMLGVPTGGPYTIHCRVKTGENVADGRRRQGLRRRPLGAGRPVEHGGRRRPDRRHAAHPRVMLWGWTANGDGRGAAALAGRFARPGPFGRSQDPRGAVGPDAQEPKQGSRPGLAVCRGAGRVRPASRSAWSPAPTAAPAWSSGARPRRRGGQQPLRLDAAAGQAGRGQGQGRALVSGRERRQGVAKPGRLSPGLLRLHRGGPLRLRSARAAVLLRPDRPVRLRRRPQGLERRAGRPARARRNAFPTRPSSR